MRRNSNTNPWFLAVVGIATLTGWVGCGGDEFTAGEQPPGTGGSMVGGGAGAAGTGGSATGGQAGASGHGGANSGGTAGSTSNGGSSGEGGSSPGGAAGDGGSSTGGASGDGGSATGGASGDGGSSGEGGANAGGASGEGGANAGGASGQSGTGGMGGTPCNAGQTLCGASCVELMNDASNCGSCGNVCTYPHAQAHCLAGAWAMGDCEPGWEDCDKAAPGCETDLKNSVLNCGSCGNHCAYPNGTPTCLNGTCSGSCTTPYLSCDNSTANGCETNAASDPLHCGSCTGACSSANASAISCEASVCGQSCNAGWLDCGDSSAGDDGCETAENDTQCGACGKACTNGMVCNKSICGCNFDLDLSCGPGTCQTNGTCSCPTANLVKQCNPGERCVPLYGGGVGGSAGMFGAGGIGGDFAFEMMGAAGINVGGNGGGVSETGYCSCPTNGDGKGTACDIGLACCTTGCQDLKADPQNCGWCGHRCAPGFICSAGGCYCDADTDCNGGSTGKCVSNACVCNNNLTCTAGKRCLSNGNCG